MGQRVVADQFVEIGDSGLTSETVADRAIDVRGEDTTYFVRRLRPAQTAT